MNALQHTATYRNTLQHSTDAGVMYKSGHVFCGCDNCGSATVFECHMTHYNTLQHTATLCNTAQHTATHCNTLKHTKTHCNTGAGVMYNCGHVFCGRDHCGSATVSECPTCRHSILKRTTLCASIADMSTQVTCVCACVHVCMCVCVCACARVHMCVFA